MPISTETSAHSFSDSDTHHQNFSAVDKHWMKYAFKLAKKSMRVADPNPHVGCVIVANNKLLGQGSTQAAGSDHAEQQALKDALTNGHDVKGATAYVSLEPCAHYGRTSPCVDALINAKVAQVVIATEDPNPRVSGMGIEKLKKAGINIRYGLFDKKARSINRGFFQRMRTGLPFAIAKMAVSADGRSAIDDGASNWITNKDSREDVQKLRSCMSAILSSAQTVMKDDPRLTARHLKSGELYPRQPLRVILDPKGELDASYQTFHQLGKVLLFVGSEFYSDTLQLFSDYESVEIVDLVATNGVFNLRDVFLELGQHEVNNILIEAGARFQGACIDAGLVNELRVYIAPHLMGQSQYGILDLPALTNMKDRMHLTLKDVKRFDQDVRLIYRF